MQFGPPAPDVEYPVLTLDIPLPKYHLDRTARRLHAASSPSQIAYASLSALSEVQSPSVYQLNLI